MSKKRLFLESAYFAPISSKQMWEHYVNDFQNVYVVAADLGNDRRYVVKSIWKNTKILGYKIWYVSQDARIYNKQEFLSCIDDITMLYGESVSCDKNFNIGKITGMHSAKCEFESAEDFNIVKGYICNRFKNKKLHHKDLIEYKYPYNDYHFTFLKCGDKMYKVTFNNLKMNQIKWIIYQGAIALHSKNVEDYLHTANVTYSFKDGTISQTSKFNFENYDAATDDLIIERAAKRLIYNAKINNIEALVKRCFM